MATRPNSLAVARSRYRIISQPPGFIVKGPGVKVRIFNEVVDIAIIIRDALNQAYQAGNRRGR